MTFSFGYVYTFSGDCPGDQGPGMPMEILNHYMEEIT